MLNWKKIIASEILDSTGFEVPVLVKELPELKEVLNNNTFLNKRIEDINFLHVTFFSHIPEQANIEKIKGNQYAQNEFIIAGKLVYLFCLKGYGNTKLNNNFF